jgi:hypothetical protein
MSGFQFERECRTLQSESFIVELDEEEVGRADIHFSPSVVYATLCVAESLSEEDVRELISEIDERLVLTTDPFREDFVVTVWTGKETGVFSDEDFEGEEGEDEDDEDEGNGHRRRGQL